MVTTAFLLNVIIYGLIAVVLVPVIHFIFFVIRESRHSGYHVHLDIPLERIRTSTTVLPLRSVAHNARAPRKNQRPSASVPGGLSQRGADGARNPLIRRLPAEEFLRGYVASNGITITPNLGHVHGIPGNVTALTASAEHPHAEYWSYGNPRTYDPR